jgi:hypothetical protein
MLTSGTSLGSPLLVEVGMEEIFSKFFQCWDIGLCDFLRRGPVLITPGTLNQAPEVGQLDTAKNPKKTRKRNERALKSVRIDETLARILSLWSALTDSLRSAILTLILASK